MLAIVGADGRAFFHGDAEEVGVGEGQAQLRRHVGALVARSQQPHFRRGVGFPLRPGLYLREDVAVLHVAAQVAQQVHHLPGEVAYLVGVLGEGQGGGGYLVAARGPPDAEVYASGVQRLQHPKVLGDLEGAVMGEHHPAAADADLFGAGGDVADEHLGAGASEVGQAVMFRHPVAMVAQFFHRGGQLDGLPQGVAGGGPGTHRRLVYDA